MRHERIRQELPRLTRRAEADALLAPAFRGLTHEEVRVLFLDGELGLLRTGAFRGTDWVSLPIRAIIADALAADARGVLLAHNHPCGDPTPTRFDRAATARLIEVAAPLGIAVVDHLIYAGERSASFRELGLL